MNNFLEGLKKQISTFRRCDDGLTFGILRKILFKFLIDSMKTLTT